MRNIVIFISLFLGTGHFGHAQNIIGTYSNGITIPALTVTFYTDSTFIYKSTEHPTFNRWEGFYEKGKWTVSADTIILNPQLVSKPFVESDFREYSVQSDTVLYLTFNHIKRYFDNKGKLIKTDTLQVSRLDYAFNILKRKNLTRVTKEPTTRCSFSGYIPPEIITSGRTIVVSKPFEELKSIFIGCFELQETKKFEIKNPNSDSLVINIYSNYYGDGQLRQKKLLIGNDKVLYSRQRPNGKFDKTNWIYGTVLKKRKNRS
jgi:hypothetical protein